METITIDKLAKACLDQIVAGNGDKKILISSDDEGNGFHELFYLFSTKYTPDENQLPFGVTMDSINDYVLLG